MRRKEQEITDRNEIDDLIKRAQVCHLSMVDGDKSYVVPMSFGYDGSSIYFHCATEGKKLDVLKKNGNVCIGFEVDLKLAPGDAACGWGIDYKSVIVFGKAEFINDMEEKKVALGFIMKQYTDKVFEFPPPAVAKTTVFKVSIEIITGKRSS